MKRNDCNCLGYAVRRHAWIGSDSEFVVSSCLLAAGAAPDAGGADADSPAAAEWRLGLGELAVENAQIEFEDRSIRPAASVGLQNVAVSVRDISNEENAVFPVSASGGLSAGGELAFDGEMTALPELSLRGAATAGSEREKKEKKRSGKEEEEGKGNGVCRWYEK